MDAFAQDVRYAIRSLRRSPGFTAAALLTLALGIGASAAIFSLLNAALIAPLPYPAADRMLVLTHPRPRDVTGQVYLHVRDRARVFERVAAQSGGGSRHLVAGDYREYVATQRISEGFLDVHGVDPILGREFSRAEDQPNGPNAALLAEPLWRRAFGGSAAVVGETVLLGDVPHVVVGIVPAGFRTIPPADVWVPLRTTSADNGANYRVLGRLNEGATPVLAAEELGTLRAGLRAEFPRYSAETIGTLTWMPYREYVGSGVRGLLLLLLAAVGLLLLIACVNVAGLQLTRALAGRRELAVRIALGGSRLRIVRLALAESLLLAVLGGVAGLAVAAVTARLIVGLVSEQLASQMLSGATVGIDWRVIAFTAGATAASGLLFGIAPALASARADLRSVMAEGVTATPSPRTVWVRRALAGAEIAIACILLVGAGLLVRTFTNLSRTDLGFNPAGVTVGRMSLQGAIDAPALESLLTRGVEAIGRVPGVAGVSASSSVPVERALNLPIHPPQGARVTDVRSVDYRYVTTEYFTVFEIRPLAGRLFDVRDTVGAPPVAIVNEAFARTYFGRTNVVGQTMVLAVGPPRPREIVGVVADAKGRSGAGWTGGLTALGSAAAPMMFAPAGQSAAALTGGARRVFDLTWSIRASESRSGLQREIEDAVAAIDPRMTFNAFEPMEAIVSRDLDVPRFAASLFAGFGVLAALLAAIGLYGLMSYAAGRRTREVGIRIALGSSRADVARRFVLEGAWIAAGGTASGLLGAAFATRAVAVLLYGVTPLDGPTFAAVPLLLFAVAIVASAIPAVRAARVNPVKALRAE